jgi:hypothetical protein
MWIGGGFPAPAPALHPVYQRTTTYSAASAAHTSAGQEAHHVARALPEFRPPVFVGNLPCPESPDSSPEKQKPTADVLVESPASPGGDTCDVRTLQRQVAQLETEKAGVEDQLRRALQKIKAQEETINELRSRVGGAEETCAD